MKEYKGLSNAQAAELLQKYGPNTITAQQPPSFVYSFFSQFFDPMMLLLIGSATLIFFTGEHSDAFLIAGILLFNALVGTLQERRIEKLVRTVKSNHPEYARVIRDSKEMFCSMNDVVPGDLILIEQGEQIPADATVLVSQNALVNEAIITGEQHAVAKETDSTVFKGSLCVAGSLYCKVTATGKESRIGKLQTLAENTTAQSPLQKDLSRIVTVILAAVIIICTSLLVIGILTKRPFAELFAALIALFICVVPQGLPVIMTLILASTAFKLLKKEFFVKKLNAVDGLSRCNVIIFDKTGTLTTNELLVTDLITSERHYTVTGNGYSTTGNVYDNHEKNITAQNAPNDLMQAATALALLQESEYKNAALPIKKSNATHKAIVCFVQKLGLSIEQAVQDYTHSEEFPIEYTHGIYAQLFDHKGSTFLFTLGAPEKLAPAENSRAIEPLLKEGKRVIAIAYKEIKSTQDVSYNNCTILGYIGLSDSIRPEAQTILQELEKAQIKTIIATGDKRETALFVTQKLAIPTDVQYIAQGSDLSTLSYEQLIHKRLFYRMSPEEKIQLLTTLQGHGLHVAMIGDGFNDVPALSQANTGIAIGARASELAKQVSDALMLDNGFVNIIEVIAYGRHVFMSFKRVILYFFTTNFSEILIIIYSFALQLPLPLLAPHILWLNLITDGFLDSSLALEPHSGRKLEKNWFSRYKHVLDRFLVARIAYQALAVTAIAAYIFTIHYKTNLMHAQTLCLATMTLCQCAMALNCRSFEKSLLSIGLLSNKILATVITGIISGLFFITSTSWGQFLFRTTPLSIHEWAIIGSAALLLIAFEELRKLIVRHMFHQPSH